MKIIIVVILIFASNASISFGGTISGDSPMCPGTSGTYTFSRNNTNCTDIEWRVYENGSIKNSGWSSSGVSCTVNWSSNFTSGEVRAREKTNLYIMDEEDTAFVFYCNNWEVNWAYKYVNKINGEPYFNPMDAAFCYSYAKTVSISSPCTNAYYDYEVPSGWKINGGSNVLNNTTSQSIQVTPPASGNGTYNLKVKKHESTNWVTKLVQLGAVQSSQVNLGKSYNMYDYTMCPSSSYAIIATGPPSTNFTNWTFNGGFSSTYGYGNQAAVTTSYNYTGGYISVKASNTCNTSAVTVGRSFSLSYSCPYSMMTVDDVNIYPNPVENEFTVEWPKEAEVTEIILFSEGKEKVVSIELNQKQKENKAIINLEGLKSDTYYLHLTDGLHVVKKHILKK